MKVDLDRKYVSRCLEGRTVRGRDDVKLCLVFMHDSVDMRFGR